MKTRVKFFASYREIAGRSEAVLDLVDGATLGPLLEDLRGRSPKLGSLTGAIIISVNKRYAKEDVVLKEGDEVVLLPPVSGGYGGFV